MAGYTKNLLVFLLIIFFTLFSNAQEVPNLLDISMILEPDLPGSGLNSNYVGQMVGFIGDFNGDGYDDWAVGLPSAADYETGINIGTVHIFLGGGILQSETAADLILKGEYAGQGFGNAVAAAGDVNNDGFDDIVVQSGYDPDITPGPAFIFYGGQIPDGEPDLLLPFAGPDDLYSGAVSGAGDVNNDGYDDILVAALPAIQGPTAGQVYLYHGGDPMDAVPDLVLTGEFSDLYGAMNYGYTVSGAGDLNNDNYDDIVVGGQNELGGGVYGAAFVHFGSSNMDSIPDLEIKNLIGAGIGAVVSQAGDVNNDGYDDLAVGLYIGGNANIYFGGESVDDTVDVTITTDVPFVQFGYSVSGGSDINGDQIDDVVVGTNGLGLGWAYIFYGGVSMDSVADMTFTGLISGERFGYSVSCNGDINQDGNSDIIVGALGDINSFTKTDDMGRILLYYGAEIMQDSATAIFSGAPVGENFGVSVDYAGDVNKDGYPDVIVGASGVVGEFYTLGQAYLFYGSEIPDAEPDVIFNVDDIGTNRYFGKIVRGAGDLNADTYPDFIIGELNDTHLYLGGAEIDTIPELDFYIPRAFTVPENVSPLGDVNNDGYDDILIGTSYTGSGSEPGYAYLYLGAEFVDVLNDQQFAGESNGDYFGSTAAAAGDLNGDGYNDFIIGASQNDFNGTNAGSVYIFYGDSVIDGIPDKILRGEAGQTWFGLSLAGGYDFNNDGFDDFVIGNSSYDVTPEGDEGRVFIFYGGETIGDSADFMFSGDIVGGNMGYFVAGIPDLNDDGYDEVMASGAGAVSGSNIYYGGDPMDDVPDITIGDIPEEVNCYSQPGESYVGILAGYPWISATGYLRGRVIVYTNSTILTDLTDPIQAQLPAKYALYHNYPNPFNPLTHIRFNLAQASRVIIKIYDLLGREVKTLSNQFYSAGTHEVEFRAEGFASGIYYYQIRAGDFQDVKKMILLK